MVNCACARGLAVGLCVVCVTVQRCTSGRHRSKISVMKIFKNDHSEHLKVVICGDRTHFACPPLQYLSRPELANYQACVLAGRRISKSEMVMNFCLVAFLSKLLSGYSIYSFCEKGNLSLSLPTGLWVRSEAKWISLI